MRKIVVWGMLSVVMAGMLAVFVWGVAKVTNTDDNVKMALKGVARQLKSIVYYEATVHNPEGDTLPDWIDDVILGKIKSIF